MDSSDICNTHSCQHHALRALGGTTAHLTSGGDHCHFPFYFAGFVFHNCITRKKCGKTCRGTRVRLTSMCFSFRLSFSLFTGLYMKTIIYGVFTPNSDNKGSATPPFGASGLVCSLSSNLEQDRRWGYCPSSMEGLWTQWSEWSRLKVMGIECGRVKKRRTRVCRYFF